VLNTALLCLGRTQLGPFGLFYLTFLARVARAFRSCSWSFPASSSLHCEAVPGLSFKALQIPSFLISMLTII